MKNGAYTFTNFEVLIKSPEQIMDDMKAAYKQMTEEYRAPDFMLLSDEFFKGAVIPVATMAPLRFDAGEAWRRNGKKRGRR